MDTKLAEKAIGVAYDGALVLLLFYKPNGFPHRLGPQFSFRITNNCILDHSNSTAAEFHDNTWKINRAHFTSYDVEGSAMLQFEDAQGGRSEVFGPFDSIRMANIVLWVKGDLFAKFSSETQLWHHAKSDTYWPAMVIKAPQR